jgi:hypothetical protein
MSTRQACGVPVIAATSRATTTQPLAGGSSGSMASFVRYLSLGHAACSLRLQSAANPDNIDPQSET